MSYWVLTLRTWHVPGDKAAVKKAGTYFDKPDEMIDLPAVQKGELRIFPLVTRPAAMHGASHMSIGRRTSHFN